MHEWAKNDFAILLYILLCNSQLCNRAVASISLLISYLENDQYKYIVSMYLGVQTGCGKAPFLWIIGGLRG